MKKIIISLLIITPVLGLVACAKNDSYTGGNDEKLVVLEAHKVEDEKLVVPENETIEINIDNWNDYFEITEGTYIEKNAFDEPEEILPSLTLELREGYTLGKDEYGNTIDYQLSVEYSYTIACHYVEMDVENCTLTIGDLYEDDTPRKESKTTTFDNYSNDFYLSWSSKEINDVIIAMDILSDIEIVRIQGSITIQK